MQFSLGAGILGVTTPTPPHCFIHFWQKVIVYIHIIVIVIVSILNYSLFHYSLPFSGVFLNRKTAGNWNGLYNVYHFFFFTHHIINHRIPSKIMWSLKYWNIIEINMDKIKMGEKNSPFFAPVCNSRKERQRRCCIMFNYLNITHLLSQSSENVYYFF